MNSYTLPTWALAHDMAKPETINWSAAWTTACNGAGLPKVKATQRDKAMQGNMDSMAQGPGLVAWWNTRLYTYINIYWERATVTRTLQSNKERIYIYDIYVYACIYIYTHIETKNSTKCMRMRDGCIQMHTDAYRCIWIHTMHQVLGTRYACETTSSQTVQHHLPSHEHCLVINTV